MTDATRRVVLAFMAHPDDAEILCGGILIRLADLGWQVHIATATAGDCGSATLEPDEIMAIRRQEAQAAAARVGGQWHCLDERDVHVLLTPETNRKAIALCRQINPTLVLTHPRQDYIVDHEQVHLLARNGAFSFPIRNALPTPAPEGARVPHLYYADPLEGRDPYTGQPVEPTLRVDISAVIERKAEMLACHASQREWLRVHHGMDEYIAAMRQHGSQRGREMGVAYAEAFRQHLGHGFPQDDLLAAVLGG